MSGAVPDGWALEGLSAPVDVLDVDLDAPSPAPAAPAAPASPSSPAPDRLVRPALVLARRDGVPVATFTAPAGTPTSELAALGEAAANTAPAVAAMPRPRRPLDEPVALRVAVVVTTILASDDLLATVDDARRQSLPPAELVVVDNRPATSGVRALLEAHGLLSSVRYVAASEPGLARARNAGLAAVTADVVAFTDDDVRLDRDWLARLVAAFDDEVDCVTGLVLPITLRTEAQLLMERFGGFAKGLQPRRYDLGENRGDGPLYPFAVGVFGTGANAAFRTEGLRAIGGFDPALGTGRVTRGGEDLDVFLRTVLAGRAVAYEPAALVRHDHEAELDAFVRRVYGYGVGLGAVMAKHLFGPAEVRRAMLRRLPAGLRHLGDPGSAKNARKGDTYPTRFTWLERLGIVVGPFAYLGARLATRRGERGRARGRAAEPIGTTEEDAP